MSGHKRKAADKLPVRVKREHVSPGMPSDEPLYRETWCPGEDFDDLLSESPSRSILPEQSPKGPFREARPAHRSSPATTAPTAASSSKRASAKATTGRRPSTSKRPAPATPSESPDPVIARKSSTSKRNKRPAAPPVRSPSPVQTQTTVDALLPKDGYDEPAYHGVVEFGEEDIDIESFLANLPVPMTRLVAHFDALGCRTATDLNGLADQTETGANVRLAVLDELTESAGLTKFERIVLEQGLKTHALTNSAKGK